MKRTSIDSGWRATKATRQTRWARTTATLSAPSIGTTTRHRYSLNRMRGREELSSIIHAILNRFFFYSTQFFVVSSLAVLALRPMVEDGGSTGNNLLRIDLASKLAFILPRI